MPFQEWKAPTQEIPSGLEFEIKEGDKEWTLRFTCADSVARRALFAAVRSLLEDDLGSRFSFKKIDNKTFEFQGHKETSTLLGETIVADRGYLENIIEGARERERQADWIQTIREWDQKQKEEGAAFHQKTGIFLQALPQGVEAATAKFPVHFAISELPGAGSAHSGGNPDILFECWLPSLASDLNVSDLPTDKDTFLKEFSQRFAEAVYSRFNSWLKEQTFPSYFENQQFFPYVFSVTSMTKAEAEALVREVQHDVVETLYKKYTGNRAGKRSLARLVSAA